MLITGRFSDSFRTLFGQFPVKFLTCQFGVIFRSSVGHFWDIFGALLGRFWDAFHLISDVSVLSHF